MHQVTNVRMYEMSIPNTVLPLNIINKNKFSLNNKHSNPSFLKIEVCMKDLFMIIKTMKRNLKGRKERVHVIYYNMKGNFPRLLLQERTHK